MNLIVVNDGHAHRKIDLNNRIAHAQHIGPGIVCARRVMLFDMSVCHNTLTSNETLNA